MVRQKLRKDQPSPSQPCSSLTHLTFDLSSLVRTLSWKPLRLESIFLRAYLTVNGGATRENEDIKLTATLGLYGAPPNSEEQSEINSAEVTVEVALSQMADQWVEVDLTGGAQKFWYQVKHSSELKISLETSVMDCVNPIEPPVHIINPAELPPELTTADPREISFQPHLLVFTDSDNHKNSRPQHRETRDKRSSDEGCARRDHPITFSDIGLEDVWIPRTLNIGKCTGSCSESTLRQHSSLGTNHARVMATVRYIQDNIPTQGERITTSGIANIPCCVPQSFYQGTPLIMKEGDGATIAFRTDYYKDLVVKTCSCQ